MRNALYGVLAGVLVFAILFWTTTRRTVRAAVLTSPPGGRFELVQLHASSETEWSGLLDTETGCIWVYTSQTPPTDAEVKAAPEGEQRTYKSYRQLLGNNFFGIVPYDDNGPTMTLPNEQGPKTFAGSRITTLGAEEFYCDQARQNVLRVAALH